MIPRLLGSSILYWACVGGIAATIATAQTTARPQATISAPCNGIWSASRSCRSFKELIEAKDDELLHPLLLPGETFVCFDPEADKFLVVYFDTPSQFLYWDKAKEDSQAEERVGNLILKEFNKGNNSYSFWVLGRWYKPKGGNNSLALFTSERALFGSEVKATISSSDLSISYGFTNRAETRTHGELTIRRSTRRFTQVLSWPQPHKASPQQTEVSGLCFHYQQGLLISAE